MAEGSILIVDDEYGVRSGIRTILEMDGYDVAEAADGAAALAVLGERDFDVGPARLPPARHRRPQPAPDHETARLRGHGVHDHGLRQHRHRDRSNAPGRGLLPAQAIHPEDLMGVDRDPGAPQAAARRGRTTSSRSTKPSLLARWPTEKSQTRSLVRVAARCRARGQPRRRGRAGQPGRWPAARAGAGRTGAATGGRVLGGGAARRRLRELLSAKTRIERRVAELTSATGSSSPAWSPSTASGGGDARAHPDLGDVTELRRMAMEKPRFIRTMVHEFAPARRHPQPARGRLDQEPGRRPRRVPPVPSAPTPHRQPGPAHLATCCRWRGASRRRSGARGARGPRRRARLRRGTSSLREKIAGAE